MLYLWCVFTILNYNKKIIKLEKKWGSLTIVFGQRSMTPTKTSIHQKNDRLRIYCDTKFSFLKLILRYYKFEILNTIYKVYYMLISMPKEKFVLEPFFFFFRPRHIELCSRILALIDLS